MPTVETSAGRFTGTESAGVRAFLGVRYAAADRFGLPWPVTGDQTCVAVGPAAPQNPDPLDNLWGVTLAPGDEDCLRLNVWAPAGTDLPVLAYVHGGAFLIGSGPWGWHDGADLARALGCVVVSFNYRLGALGFVGRPGATNLGLRDQLAALRWVQDHIARFGGDPGNVTLTGQSAGAISVACLLGSPLAAGLFRRAVCFSGGPTLVRSREVAERVAAEFLREAGGDHPDDLRAMSLEDLLAAQKRTMAKSDFGGPRFVPEVGDDVLPTYPLDRLNRSVPLVCSYARDEMRLWTLYAPPLAMLPAGALRPWLRRLVGGRADAVLAIYGPNGLLPILGDVIFRLPVLRLAEAHGAARVLRLDYAPPVAGDLGTPHSLDMALLFGNFSAPGIRRLVGPRPEAARDRLRAVVGAFARTGAVDWPAYGNDRATLLLGESAEVVGDPNGAERACWDGLPFDGRRPAPDDLPRKRELLLFLLGRFARRWLPWLLVLGLLAAGWAFLG